MIFWVTHQPHCPHYHQLLYLLREGIPYYVRTNMQMFDIDFDDHHVRSLTVLLA